MKTTPGLLRSLALLSLALLASVPVAAATFQRGVNISHWLSQNEPHLPYAAPWFTEADVAWIAAQGFDHIRMPVDLRLCLAADGSLDEAKIKPIADSIRWSRAHHLGYVLDAHFLPGADFNSVGGDRRVYTDPKLTETVAGVWRALAKRFAAEPDDVRFEILNEPVATENQQLNPFMHRMLAVIRESNPTRVVYIASNKWNSFHTVRDVVLPKDEHIALTIHFYEPMAFTHQRASWVGFKDSLPPVEFPGQVPDLTGHTTPLFGNYIKAGDPLTAEPVEKAFADVAAWVDQHAPGIEVYVGEFGVYKAAPAESTKRWLRLVRHECERRHWSWAIWDYNDSFGVRNAQGGGTPVLEGLFKD